MFPGVNPRQMQSMMKKMGMKQVDIAANEVIIKTEDSIITISNPSVSKINMMGQETFQITGSISEESVETTPDINDEDIQTVVDQTGVSKEVVKESLIKNEGDLARTILELKQ